MISAIFAPVCPCHPGRLDKMQAEFLQTPAAAAPAGRDQLAAAHQRLRVTAASPVSRPYAAPDSHVSGSWRGNINNRGEAQHGSRPTKTLQEVTLLPPSLLSFRTLKLSKSRPNISTLFLLRAFSTSVKWRDVTRYH